MDTLLELTRWYGEAWRGYAAQLTPTVAELVAAGAVATGECPPDCGEADLFPPERDKRTWYLESPRCTIILLLVPDWRGFYLEDELGDRWRPASLTETLALLREMETLAALTLTQLSVSQGNPVFHV